MRFFTTFMIAASAVLLASAAHAQDSVIAPVPLPAPAQERITPENDTDSSAILSTHKNKSDTQPPAAALPWSNATPPAPIVAAPAQGNAPFSTYQGKSPFGHAEPMAPIIPSGPHETISVPVVGVDAQEPAEAAPPTPVVDGADPAKEDPAEPTELTSPIFGGTDTSTGPRKIIIRLLNKVTAQSSVLTFKPNETVKIGQLEITAITCQVSAPQSQTDYAGLLDIVERSADGKTAKPLFRGWMYASSPSISALEHPVYDVTMVECQTTPPPMKKEEKAEEKPAKKGKK